MHNTRETLLAQYGNSCRLCGLVESFSQACDPCGLIEVFYEQVWNPDTATGWGLDVWGRIVGAGRVLDVPPAIYLCFDEANDGSGDALPFNDGFFYAGQTITSNHRLTDDAYRRLILAKASANITNGSIADINRLLMLLFEGRGNIWVQDNANMSMTLCHDFNLTPVDATIVETTGILPKPAGTYFRYQTVIL